MFHFHGKTVLVIGLGVSGAAAAELSRSRGATVIVVDAARNPALEEQACKLRERGVTVELGATTIPPVPLDLAVISPGVALDSTLAVAARERRVPLMGELELGYQQSLALAIAITGTNGKTTTTELIERLLTRNHFKTVAAGNIGTPLCAVAPRARELDFVTLEVSSFQLETIEFFRPAVAVLLNITPDHLDRYPGLEDYARAKARLFENQQAFDWAIVQVEALAALKRLGLEPPGKVITFSATDQSGDLYLDRGLIISRMEHWAGPLLDMDAVPLRGPHNAENIMAALAVGRVLRIPLEGMVEALKSYPPAPHRCELVAEIDGVKFVNDSKATNVDAVAKALLSMPSGNSREANVWLLAGGRDKGLAFHDLGPLLSGRVKGAFLFGETRDKIRAAWSLFTPCATVPTLIEAVVEAAKRARPGDVVLLSPACSSFDQFRNYQERGEVFRQAVSELEKRRPNNSGSGDAAAERSGRCELMML